jgi:SAM-dependent methyltransferase
MVICPLIRRPDPVCFSSSLRSLHQYFDSYATNCPAPLPAPGLIITPEIRYQSELYLPIAKIRRLFYRLYNQALNYPPLFSSSPFHATLSWADCYATLPPWLQLSPDPARLLGNLLDNEQLLHQFIFYSFLPPRFNGAGFGRYPGQLAWLQKYLFGLRAEGKTSLRTLDAACGSGEGAWELAELLTAHGWKPEQAKVEGWTLEPLEVWAAEQQRLPHAPKRQQQYQQRVQPLLEQGWGSRVNFKAVDLLTENLGDKTFDLILCNGLLGGPIINQQPDLERVVAVLSRLLAPEGILLAANHFHGGWQKQVPQTELVQLLSSEGLEVQLTGEGLAAVKRYRSPD